jgi:hypothetical protein
VQPPTLASTPASLVLLVDHVAPSVTVFVDAAGAPSLTLLGGASSAPRAHLGDSFVFVVQSNEPLVDVQLRLTSALGGCVVVAGWTSNATAPAAASVNVSLTLPPTCDVGVATVGVWAADATGNAAVDTLDALHVVVTTTIAASPSAATLVHSGGAVVATVTLAPLPLPLATPSFSCSALTIVGGAATAVPTGERSRCPRLCV